MGFTYTNSPKTVIIDAIRLACGDTLERDHKLEDEEIRYFYDEEESVFLAAARACEALAARYASQEVFRGGTFTIQKTSVATKYLAMARSLRRRATTSGSFLVPAMSVADKQANEDDTTIVQPSFRRGMHDNPDPDADEDDDAVN